MTRVVGVVSMVLVGLAACSRAPTSSSVPNYPRAGYVGSGYLASPDSVVSMSASEMETAERASQPGQPLFIPAVAASQNVPGGANWGYPDRDAREGPSAPVTLSTPPSSDVMIDDHSAGDLDTRFLSDGNGTDENYILKRNQEDRP